MIYAIKQYFTTYIDFLILDGTSLSQDDDFKKMSLTHIKKDILKHKQYFIYSYTLARIHSPFY